MVLNSGVVVWAANTSARFCQYIACNPEHLSSQQVLDLLFCLPFQQIRRLSLFLWTLFCYPAPEPFFYLSSTSSSSSSSSSSSQDSISSVAAYDLHAD